VNVFRDPSEVLEHPWFTDEEKKAVLMSWARDELVVEQVASNVMPEPRPKWRIDAVIEALSRSTPPPRASTSRRDLHPWSAQGPEAARADALMEDSSHDHVEYCPWDWA